MPQGERERVTEELVRELRALREEVRGAGGGGGRGGRRRRGGGGGGFRGRIAAAAGSAAKAGLVALGVAATRAATASWRNPSLSFGTAMADIAGGAAALVGVATQERRAVELAEQRLTPMAGAMGRLGAPMSAARLRELLDYSRAIALREVRAVDELRAVAAQTRGELVAPQGTVRGVLSGAGTAASKAEALGFGEEARFLGEKLDEVKAAIDRLGGVFSRGGR